MVCSVRWVVGLPFALLTAACAGSAPTAATAKPPARNRAAAPAEAATAGTAKSAGASGCYGGHGCGEHVLADPTILVKPQAFLAGYGHVHHEVSAPAGETTAAAEAQRYYDQGLAALHNFVWIEAERAFNEVLRRSPECAMAWLGISRAESGLARKSEARRALEKARELADRATPVERRFIDLRALQLDAIESARERQKELHANYKTELERAIAEFPDDVELLMLRGNAEESSPGGIGQGAQEGSVAWYERVIARVPDHFGAHHCLVHAHENRGDHANSLKHAEVYLEQAPAVPHAWHMRGHELPRFRRWDEARHMFEEAERLSAEYERKEGIRPGDDWHRAHNLLLLGYVELYSGRFDRALEWFRRQLELPIAMERGEPSHVNVAEVLLAAGRFDEARKVARDLQERARYAATRAAAAAVEGELFLRDGDVARARAKLEQCDAALADVTSETNSSPNRGARACRTLLAAQIDLAGTDGSSAENGQKTLIAFADDVAGNPRFDAWSEGLLRLHRAWRAAQRLGLAPLAGELETRMHKIDSSFDPVAFVP